MAHKPRLCFQAKTLLIRAIQGMTRPAIASTAGNPRRFPSARLRAMRGPGESYSDVILRLSADAPGRIVPRGG